ncbi:MAG: DUF4367 domain-containing protein [Clostridia bacterium]|nr:DUF4367 domain-containing protein [Clostridia bacterium]
MIKKRIEWHRMKKIALDHPYFDVKAHRLTCREAEKLLQGHVIPNGRDVLNKVRAELNMPQMPSSAVAKKGNRSNFVPSRGLKRLVITFVVLILITAFFAFTPIGNTWAKAIYSVIVQLLEGNLHAHNVEPASELQPIDFDNLPEKFSSLEEVAEITNRTLLVPDEGSEPVSIASYMMNESSLVVVAEYSFDNGRLYFITYTLYNDALWASSISSTEEELNSITLSNGLDGYIGQMKDGTVYMEAYERGIIINISSVELSLEELQEVALSLRESE